MKITFFDADNPTNRLIGEELLERGYDIKFNEIDDNTDLCISMTPMASLKMVDYLALRKYKGKIGHVILDVPVWRLNDKKWHQHYLDYVSILKCADYLFSLSKCTTKMAKEIWKVDSEPLFTEFTDKLMEKYKKDLKREHQIVCISRFMPHKRFELVLSAIKDTDWKICLIGHGEGLNLYQKLIYNYKLNAKILINPPKDVLVEEICKSEVCVMPSIFEGKSYVPKEALWCNTPVIITDIEVNKEFHSDTVNYFKPDDIDDLKRVLMDKENWIPAEIGKKHIEQFTVAKVTDNIEKWLKKNIK